MKGILQRMALSALVLGVACGSAWGQGGSLGPVLRGLGRKHARGGPAAVRKFARARNLRLRKSRGRTLVPVILEPRAGAGSESIDLTRIRRIGGVVDAVSASFVRVLVPASKLKRLAAVPGVRLARTATPRKPLGGVPHVAESAELTGAAELHRDGVFGTGVKVAVVDLGFIGLADSINTGKLPWNTVVVDLPGGNDDDMESETVHGVGVSEHVMSMAPGAELHVIMVGDEVDLENAAAYCRDNGIAVANHSVGWVIASYYDDTGPINQIINDSHDNDGVFWAVAAGNDAKRHWRHPDTEPTTWTTVKWRGEYFDWLEFSPGDYEMELQPGGGVIFLNWDQYDGAVTDLDLWIFDSKGTAIAASQAPQNGTPGQQPSEAVSFNYNASNGPYYLRIRLWSGSTDGLDMTLFSFYNDFVDDAVASSSFMDPANAHGAFSVAAIHQFNWTMETPPPASYSSQGPTNDGRQKPDIAAPDGTSSWAYGIEDSYGTSFSSPTTAGAAALVLSMHPFLSPDEVAAILRRNAIDIGDPGLDPVFGAGKLNLLGDLRPTVTTVGADLVIAKSVSPDFVAIGDTLTYTITVRNEGYSDASGVTVTDVLPSEVSYVSGTSTQGSCTELMGTVDCNLGNMAYGTTATVTIVVEADESGGITNTATVSANEDDPDGANNSATSLRAVIAAEGAMFDISPSSGERWMDIGANEFRLSYRNSYDYASDPSVTVHWAPVGDAFLGWIEATGLKPNFAYQIKLDGNRDYPTAFENIGYNGRWWIDGEGTNVLDSLYEWYKANSPGTNMASYILVDYFVTDGDGDATKYFLLDSTYHVLWSPELNSGAMPDGDDSPVYPHVFSLDNELAYDPPDPTEYTTNIWLEQEWVNTRPAIGEVQLPAGCYVAKVILTEESFHQSGETHGGTWASVLALDVEFTIE